MSAFSLERQGGIAVLVFNRTDAPVNTLSSTVVTELIERLDEIETDPGIKAVVLRSGKPEHFIAGADITELVALETADAAQRLSRTGQAVVDRVEACPKPIVAAIHGACLGGGLELALGCHYRVASTAPSTRLGLPEVQLGLIPGAGGTQRLPRLIGVRAALDIILPGRSVDARRARRLGLVDESVPPAIVEEVAHVAAVRLATGWRPRRTHPTGVTAAVLERNPLGRRLVYRAARRRVLARTGGHYPAPLAALDAVRHGLSHGLTAGLQREAERFGELALGPVSRNLISLYFATKSLEKDSGVGRNVASPSSVRRVGVVGAGFMGAGIAGVAALRAEVDVRLRDTSGDGVARGIAAARAILDERRRRGRLDRHAHYRLAALISGTTDWRGFGRRDLVIEAVFEELAVKQSVVEEIEAVVPATCLVASNTSTLSISRLQSGARHPGRILGMHFFSPVEKLPLLEIIRGEQTTDETVASAVAFGRRLGKTVIVVQDAPGFWVNRILAPYLNEAVRLLLEGIPIETIDETMTRLGFPVGPITLLDEVGLDVAAKAAAVLHEAFGPRLEPLPVLDRLISAERLGRKTGRGFHRFDGDKKQGVDGEVYARLGVSPGSTIPADLDQRLVLPMLNEAVRALDEQVVHSPRDGDIGAIFGCGFPPFLGGPFRVLDRRGVASVHADLESLADRHGDRFRPAPRLETMARTGARFYPAS